MPSKVADLIQARLPHATEAEQQAALRALYGLQTTEQQRVALLQRTAFGFEPEPKDWELWVVAGVLAVLPSERDLEWVRAECAAARAAGGKLGRGKKGPALLAAEIAIRFGFEGAGPPGDPEALEAERLKFTAALRLVKAEFGEYEAELRAAAEQAYGEVR